MAVPEYVVRAARPADAPAAAALAAELVRFHHRLDSGRFALLADPLEPGYARFLAARSQDKSAVVLVAEWTDTTPAESSATERPARLRRNRTGPRDRTRRAAPSIVGYAFGRVEGPSWPDLLDTHGRFHDLFVRPEYRGRGIGRALATEMRKQLCARGAPRIVLTIAWDNPTSRGLFERLGCRPTMIEMTQTC